MRPPMTRMVTRSHPCESDTELPMPSKSWRAGEGLSFSSLGRPRWRKSMQISDHPFPIYGLRNGALKRISSPDACWESRSASNLCICLLPRFLLRSCDYFVCSFGLSSTESHLRFPPRRSFVSIIFLFATPACACVVFTTCRIGNYGLVRRHRRAKIAHPAGLLRRLGFEGKGASDSQSQ